MQASEQALRNSDGQEAGPSLARVAVHGGLWVLLGHGLGQALRLAGNLILTRLLFPEAFGLMALVQIVAQGVGMFSDIGLRGSVIHDARGEERSFLDTAWTLQIGRGVLVAGVVAALAWPMARFYDHPELAVLILAVSITAVIDGFRSTSVYTLMRRIEPRRRVAMDLGSQAVGLAVTVTWAVLAPSVWALVGGAIATAAARTALSFSLIPGHRDRLGFDRPSARSMIRFGRWIFVSTAMTFVFTQADRAVLGKMMTASDLGVYSIAFFLSQAALGVAEALAVNILFPVYARLAREGSDRLRAETTRLRMLVMALSLPPLWLVIVAGPEVVGLLYDPRYHEAGWMLQILAVGMVGGVVRVSCERIMTARGDSFRHMVLQTSQAALLVVGIAVGAHLDGVRGLLVGVSAARLLGYGVLALLIRPYGVWTPALDGAVFLATALFVATGVALR